MAKQIAFTKAEVEWVEFRPDPVTGDAQMRAFGYITNTNGDRLPRDITGWDGIPDGLVAAIKSALKQLMAIKAADELGVAPQDISTLLDAGPTYLQFKAGT